MNIFKKWFGRSDAPQPVSGEDDILYLVVKCDECGEKIEVRINKKFDLQNEYLEQGEKAPAWTLRKEVLGKGCFNLMEVYIEFDIWYNIITQKVKNGELISIGSSES